MGFPDYKKGLNNTPNEPPCTETRILFSRYHNQTIFDGALAFTWCFGFQFRMHEATFSANAYVPF